jgi:hypothetical protein
MLGGAVGRLASQPARSPVIKGVLTMARLRRRQVAPAPLIRGLQDWFRNRRNPSNADESMASANADENEPGFNYARDAASRGLRFVFAKSNEPKELHKVNSLLECAWGVSRCCARVASEDGSSPALTLASEISKSAR